MATDKQQMRQEFHAWCVREKSEAEEMLGRFESGMLKIGVYGPEGHKDGSDQMIEHLRHVITNMEHLATKVQADIEAG